MANGRSFFGIAPCTAALTSSCSLRRLTSSTIIKKLIRAVAIQTLAAALVLPALAQQRMGIAAGSFEVGANEAAQIPTYCLDFSRSTPTSSDAYRHVLTGNESATVHFDDGSSMSLQQALQRDLVRATGHHISLEDLFKLYNDPTFQFRNPMTPRQRQAFTTLQQLWNEASAEDRRQIEEAFERDTPTFWDHTHLQIVNNSRRHLRITFDEPTVLSPMDESLQGTAYTHIGSAKGLASDNKVQQELWQLGDVQQQSALAYLGFYNGPLDGLTGPTTKGAIRKFQAAQNLPITGEFDSATTTALHTQVNMKRLSGVNGSGQGLSLITITNTPSNAQGRYTVNFGPGQNPFATNNPTELSQRLNSFIASSGNKRLYVDFDSFSNDKARALAGNLERQQKALDPSVDLHGITRSEADPELQGLWFEPLSKIDAGQIRVEEVTSGPKKGFFRGVIDLVLHFGKSVKRVSIAIVSATREYAVELAELLRSAILSTGSDNLPRMQMTSVAQIVSAVEKNFRARHPNISDDAYSKELQSQFGTVDISFMLLKACTIG